MNPYDARQQFIDGLDRYVSGIETDDGLQKLASNVKAYNDPLPAEACEIVGSIAWPLKPTARSFAGASELLLQRFRAIGRDGKSAVERK
jgi:hypothetical protein